MAVIITAIRANCHCCKQITLVEPAFPECRLSAESIFFESKFSIRLAPFEARLFQLCKRPRVLADDGRIQRNDFKSVSADLKSFLDGPWPRQRKFYYLTKGVDGNRVRRLVRPSGHNTECVFKSSMSSGPKNITIKICSI
ncbi:hypothetical protein M514_08100 [Trichuris suis]|uniref:Uncharacterized protein n=1 Tax=Trichuris suis TaxID=68888 RepID=A0A085M1G3_9BILA|nr:hypothetical protein M513_08100 [Trichuris suis]KFD73274.1 hypothetical protein M514_08100 [Trichuris suis]